MAQITDRTTFFDFWRDEIATRCNAINSFVEFENDKALDAFKSGQNTPALVMFDPEFFPVDQRSDNFQRRIQFGFYVVKKAALHEDQDEIATLKNDCLIIVQDIIARLNKLNEDKEFFGRFWSDKAITKPLAPYSITTTVANTLQSSQLNRASSTMPLNGHNTWHLL